MIFRARSIPCYMCLLFLALFTFVHIPLTHADSGKKASEPKVDRDDDRHERLRKSARKLIEAEGRGEDISAQSDEVAKDAAEIEAEDLINRKRFEEIEKKLSSLRGGSAALTRHRNVRDEYEKKSAERKGHIDTFKKARKQKDSPKILKEKVRGLLEFEEKHKIKREYDIKSTDNRLPWRMVKPGDILLLGDVSGAPQQADSAASTTPPTADDLSPTAEVQITPEIQQLAASLNHSPLEIFRHVYNTYNFTMYNGSMKGSLDTYWEKEGNDADLASLLIALFRASNIPARYVRAQILVPIERIQNQIGIDEPMAALQALSMARKLRGYYTAGGRISHARLEHIYVEAHIPYTNYRGTGEDDKGKGWVPFDPSFKRYDVAQQGVDLTAAMGFDWKSFSTEYLSSLQNITPLEHYRNKVDDFIGKNYPGQSLDTLKRTTAIKTMKFDFLPNTLPYKVTEVIGRFPAMPPDLGHTLRFTIPGVLDYATTLPEASGRRITLNFAAATAEDQTVIDAYGGIFKTPPYLIEVLPQLRVGGVKVAEGSPVNAAGYLPFNVTYGQPGRLVETFGHHVLAGSYNAVGITTGKVRPEFLSISEVETSDEIYLAKMVHSLAMKYHDALNKTRQTLNDTMRMQSKTFFTEALVSTHQSVAKVLGDIPVSFDQDGFMIDAKELAMAAMPIDGQNTEKKLLDFSMTFGHEASYQENRVFENNMFWVEGTSAVKGLQMLAALGVPISELEPNATYANANLPNSVVSDINDALNMGWKVMAPEETGCLAAVPYIKYDEKTGSAGYMIAAIAGGLAQETMDMTWLKDFWQKNNINYNLEVRYPDSPHLVAMGDNFLVWIRRTAKYIGSGEMAQSDDEQWVITNANYYLSRNKPVPMHAVVPGQYTFKFDGRDLLTFHVSTGLTIDSVNSGGLNTDGTYVDPRPTVKNELIEGDAALPGKLIPLNSGDINNDGVPDFADGYDLTTSQPATGGSAAFIPITVNIPEPIDLEKAQITFNYSASDPAVVTINTESNGRKTYVLAPGKIRVWTKDGGKARLKASVANGGDFVKPGEVVTAAQLGAPIDGNPRVWKLFIEGVSPSSKPGEEKISYDIKAPPYYLTDSINATVMKPILLTDYNRDRTIDDTDRQIAASGKAFYFWVNDDDDSDDINSENNPQSGTNGIDQIVNGMTDLEDLFPVHLDIQALLKSYNPTSFKYVLRHDQSALNFLFADLAPLDSGKYLTDATDTGVAQNVSSAKTYQISKVGIVLNDQPGGTDFLQGILNANKGVILVEGRTETSKPLILEIVDKKTGKAVLTSGLNTSISGVEQMFRHKNLMQEMYKIEQGQLPQPPGVTSIEKHKVPNEGMPDRLDFGQQPIGFQNYKHFSGFDKESDDINFVHVHGYNVNGQDARGEQAEVFKRLFWSGSKAKFWGITWYGWDSQKVYGGRTGTRSPNFHVNVRHAFNAGKLLSYFVQTHAIGNATFSAHSLGNMVVSTAIQNYMPYTRYLMANAAVAEEAYIDQKNYDTGDNWNIATRPLMYNPDWRYPYGQDNKYEPFLWYSEWYKLFTDTNDERSKLTWRNNFSKVRNDNVYTFFAPTDQAFMPFKLTLDEIIAAQGVTDPAYNGEKSKHSIFWTIIDNWFKSSDDPEIIGTYSWSYQELMKGTEITSWVMFSDSLHGGWGFNLRAADEYINKSCTGTYPDQICSFITPQDANVLDPAVLKSKPIFDKNQDNSGIFTDNLVTASELNTPLREKILANESPALTFAAGHRGVENTKIQNVDIRAKYLAENSAKPPWPRKKYEWRHSDIFNVAYPYVNGLYNDWVKLLKGAPIQ